MYAEDSDALECDLAETYGLFDLQSIPLRKLATLAYGLRDNSRIKQKISGLNVEVNTLMLAFAVDRLSWLVWSKTKDGQKGRNMPESVANILLHGDSAPDSKRFDADVFDSPEAFKAERERIIQQIQQKVGEDDA